MREGSRKYSKCHLNVLALADLPILPQRAVSQEIDSLLPHRMSPVIAHNGRRLPICRALVGCQKKLFQLPTQFAITFDHAHFLQST
jgi:hypothetical protein